MTTGEALQHYLAIVSKVFSRWNRKCALRSDDLYKSSTLEEEMKRVIQESSTGYTGEELMLDRGNWNGTGYTYQNSTFHPKNALTPFRSFVCVTPTHDMLNPRRLCTYKAPWNETPECKIWEAAHATSAVPTLLKPIQIDSESFVAGANYSNPTREVVDEARNLFGTERPVGLLLSIGAGFIASCSLAGSDRRGLPKILKDVELGSSQVSHDLAIGRSINHPDFYEVYFRFDVIFVRRSDAFDEWNKMERFSKKTNDDLRAPERERRIDLVARILCGVSPESERGRLGSLWNSVFLWKRSYS